MIKTEHTEKFTILHDPDCSTHMALSVQRGCTGHLDFVMVTDGTAVDHIRVFLMHDGENCPLHERANQRQQAV